MIASARTLRRCRRIQQLRLIDWLDVDQLIEGVDGRSVQVVRQVVHTCLQILVPFVEEVLRSSALTVIARRDKKRIVVLQFAQCLKNLEELLCATLLLLLLPRLGKGTLSVAHERSTGTTAIVSIDADPDRLELCLDHLQTIKRTHVAS